MKILFITTHFHFHLGDQFIQRKKVKLPRRKKHSVNYKSEWLLSIWAHCKALKIHLSPGVKSLARPLPRLGSGQNAGLGVELVHMKYNICITIISIPVKWHKSIDHIFKYSWKKCRINLIIALGVSRDIKRPRRHGTLCPPPEYASASKKSTWTWLGMICVKASRSAAAAFAFCSLSWRKITDRDKIKELESSLERGGSRSR